MRNEQREEAIESSEGGDYSEVLKFYLKCQVSRQDQVLGQTHLLPSHRLPRRDQTQLQLARPNPAKVLLRE